MLPQNRARVPALEGLRGLASLMVFFHHTLQSPTGGYLGVDLFFVLSGFFISSILIREIQTGSVPKFIRFYQRRAQRLLPAFCIMILLYMCMRFCFALAEPALGLRQILRILMLSNFNGAVPYLSHCWSLSIEWQFYFVWPWVLTFLVMNGTRRLRLLLLIVTAVIGIWIVRAIFHIDIRIDGLLLGSAIALIDPNISLQIGRAGQLIAQGILVIALIATVALVFISNYAGTVVPTWFGYTAMPLLGVVMVTIVSRSSGLVSKVALENPVLIYFGKISYSLYLYHFPIAALMYVHGYSPLPSTIVGLVVCVPLSDFSWRYIELPILRIGVSPNQPTKISDWVCKPVSPAS